MHKHVIKQYVVPIGYKLLRITTIGRYILLLVSGIKLPITAAIIASAIILTILRIYAK